MKKYSVEINSLIQELRKPMLCYSCFIQALNGLLIFMFLKFEPLPVCIEPRFIIEGKRINWEAIQLIGSRNSQ